MRGPRYLSQMPRDEMERALANGCHCTFVVPDDATKAVELWHMWPGCPVHEPPVRIAHLMDNGECDSGRYAGPARMSGGAQ